MLVNPRFEQMKSMLYRFSRLRSNDGGGFTLVELLVVISIIAILSVVGLTIFSEAQKAARDARRRADIDTISAALELYKTYEGSYPLVSVTGAALGTWNVSWSSHLGLAQDDPTDWKDLGDTLASYIRNMPVDPQNIDSANGCSTVSSCHLYHYCSDGTSFILIVNLEGPSNQQGTPDLTNCPTGGSNLFWAVSRQ